MFMNKIAINNISSKLLDTNMKLVCLELLIIINLNRQNKDIIIIVIIITTLILLSAYANDK